MRVNQLDGDTNPIISSLHPAFEQQIHAEFPPDRQRVWPRPRLT
jgi:hypothetical protein